MTDQIPDHNLHIDNEIRSYLADTSKWARFIAIVGFVFVGLLVIIGFGYGAIFSSLTGNDDVPGFLGYFIGFIYVVMAGIYFFPLLYLFRFSNFTKKGFQEADQVSLNLAFKNLKDHYSFIGILTAIMLAIYGMGALVGVVVLLFTTLV